MIKIRLVFLIRGQLIQYVYNIYYVYMSHMLHMHYIYIHIHTYITHTHIITTKEKEATNLKKSKGRKKWSKEGTKVHTLWALTLYILILFFDFYMIF